MNNAKGYIIGVLAALVLGVLFSRGCFPDKTVHTVVTPVEAKITPQDKKIMPDITRKNVYTPPKPEIGKKLNVDILNSLTRTVLVENQVFDWGWDNRVVLGVVGRLDGLEAGLGYRGPFWYRIGATALIGTKSAGLGVDWQLFRNTFTGVSWNYSYLGLPSPAVYMTLGF